MNKRGLSEVVTLVLVVLIVLAAIILIWAFVRPTIQDTERSVNIDRFTTNLVIVAESVRIGDEGENEVSFDVKRESGKGSVSGVNVILKDVNQNEELFRVNIFIRELEIKPIFVNYSNSDLAKLSEISIAPIIRAGQEEIILDIQDTYKISGAEETDVQVPSCGNGEQEAGEDCDGNDLGGLECSDVGDYTGGELGCTECVFDTSMCTNDIPECGNGLCEPPDEDELNCPSDCQIDDPNENFVALQIGTAALVNTETCWNEGNPQEEFTCYNILIECPEIPEIDMDATVRVGTPLNTTRGTIVLGSGGGGQDFWGDRHGDISRAGVLELREMGFQTAEISFPDGWGKGFDLGDGTARTGCRPAATFQWIYDEIHTNKDEAFCSTGNSGGASQISTTLSRYDFNEFDLAVITGGPPTARMDLGCIEEGDPDLWFPDTNAQSLDKAWGWPNPNLPEYEPGPCGIRDDTWRTELEEAGIVFDTGRYFFDSNDIYISMMHGEDAEGNSEPQGLLYRDALEAAGTVVDFTLVNDTGHGVYSTEIGVDTIVQKIDEQCIPR